MSYTIRSLKTFKKAVAAAGTAVPLAASKKIVRKLMIAAYVDNTSDIFLGDSSVDAATGFVLAPGVAIKIEDLLYNSRDVYDLNEIYIDAAVNDEFVTVIYSE